jgi:hypothetical protein
MSTEEVNATYYSREDLTVMRLQIISVLERILQKDLDLDFFRDTKKSNSADEDEELCTRGLETKTRPFASKRRQSNKRRARATVIEEQEFQREMGRVDDEYLADLYIITTQGSVNAAIEMAIQDEIEAKNCHGRDAAAEIII